MNIDVAVIGSINYDVSVLTPRLPRPGETVLGTGHFQGPGGKGANQAVAAARLGASVALIGRVGPDEWGRKMLEGLGDEGIDVSAVTVDPSQPTGVAVITIDEEAENTIVASAGANRRLTAEQVHTSRDLISGARVVLAQLEVPIEAIEAASSLVEGIFCLNPAPASPIPASLLDCVDILVPNRSELARLSGNDGSIDDEMIPVVARSLLPGGTTVVTLGGDGVLVVGDQGLTTHPAHEVRAVDPTGAGDTFCAGLAVSLGRGDGIEEAVDYASAAAALAVTRRGAQSGMPTDAEVERFRAG